jgi:chemosensory pili system protein ChpE
MQRPGQSLPRPYAEEQSTAVRCSSFPDESANIAYWAAMGSALGAVGVQQPTALHYASFFGGFMLSSIVWSFLFAALVARVLGGVGLHWSRITHRACAVAFLALALASLRELWISLRPDASTQAPNAISMES